VAGDGGVSRYHSTIILPYTIPELSRELRGNVSERNVNLWV